MRNYTKSVKVPFQWFFDINTKADEMQVITVSAGGSDVITRLAPFFSAYKYFKLGPVKCSFVPASTLPVDPTGLSYEAGENTVDPRDQLNPGLTRITNGEDCLDNLTGVSSEVQQKMYYSMMMDTRWYKWSLQSGLKRFATPRFWQIGQLHHDIFPGAVTNLPQSSVVSGTDDLLVTATGSLNHYSVNDGTALEPNWVFHNQYTPSNSSPYGIFQTGHKGRLGYLPTDSYNRCLFKEDGNLTFRYSPGVAPVPEVEVFKVILPPAYKTKYYYRVYVTEVVYFTGLVVNNYDDYGGLDRFVRTYLPNQLDPTVDFTPQPVVGSPNDGGGTP